MSKTITIALAGNPNTGKTTIFNALTGLHQKVGNYAGVTVEKREGVREYKGYTFRVFDLPGVYSLTAYSIDEMVARDFILDEKPDVIIDVLDSTNIERNLYLCLQFQELGALVIGALNLSDEAAERRIAIDEKILSNILRMPMVKTAGIKGQGVERLLDQVIESVTAPVQEHRPINYGDELGEDIALIVSAIQKDDAFCRKHDARWFTIKLLEKDSRAIDLLKTHALAADVEELLHKQIKRIEEHFGRDSAVVVAEQRYGYIHGATAEAVKRAHEDRLTVTEKIDKVLLNRFLGLPIFLFILWSIFQATFVLSSYPMLWLEGFFSWLSQAVSLVIPNGVIHSLLTDGVIAGVGGVTSFIPLIIFLFFFISILEDSGYMCRSAFIMDKFLHIFGLHGQSFLPLVIGFGCSVPAIMAARTLKNMRDRIITILVTPFMSCGAKLPIHMLLAGAFFPLYAGNVVLSIYLIGVLLALGTSFVFRKTILKGDSTPFVMELPPYRVPTIKGILWHVREKTFRYVTKAGVVLLPVSILIWALTTFPQPTYDEAKYQALTKSYQEELLRSPGIDPAQVDQLTVSYIGTARAQERISQSFAGQIGKVIEPVVRPLGFDWKIGISAVTGFAAKEMVVSTLGVLYKVGEDAGQKGTSLREALKKDPAFNPLVAYVLMLFMLIVVPCFASVTTIYYELGWKWLVFSVTYLLFMSWFICFIVYQTGLFFGLGVK